MLLDAESPPQTGFLRLSLYFLGRHQEHMCDYPSCLAISLLHVMQVQIQSSAPVCENMALFKL